MSGRKLLYKISRNDQDKSMTGIYFKKPKVIGFIENDGVQLKTTNKIKYFKIPKADAYPLDLNAGFESYKTRSENFKWKLHKVACFLMNPNEFNVGVGEPQESNVAGELDDFDGLEKFDVVTHRGALALLMETPYMSEKHFQTDWSIVATKYNKKLYLSTVKNESQISRESCAQNPSMSYHFKFEQYCFTDDPIRDPDTTVPINEEQQIYCIYKTQLLNFNLIYSAEINGILSENKLGNIQDFDALERCRFVHTKLMPDRCRYWMKNFRLCRWWIKAYLARVDDVYVGLKTEDGLVTQPVKHMLTKQLAERESLHERSFQVVACLYFSYINPNCEVGEMVRTIRAFSHYAMSGKNFSGQKWSPKVCVNFVYKFIEMVLQEMRDVDDPEKCFEFNFSSLSGCIYVHVNERPFLTEDFVNFLKRADA